MLKALNEHFRKIYVEERATRSLEGESLVNKGDIWPLGVEELENRVTSLQRESEAAVTPPAIHPADYRALMAAQASDARGVLASIRHRV